MSKTDKTRPWNVKAKENPLEHHDHRDGVCDLAKKNPPTTWSDGKCYTDAAWWRPEFRCHCNLCDGTAYGYGPKQINRKARQAAKKITSRVRRFTTATYDQGSCDCKCHQEHDAQMVPFCIRCDNDYANLCNGRYDD